VCGEDAGMDAGALGWGIGLYAKAEGNGCVDRRGQVDWDGWVGI